MYARFLSCFHLTVLLKRLYTVPMNRKTIATHDGAFHADDVLAVATLLLLEPEAIVVRVRDEATIAAADFAVDVGGVYDEMQNRFDHHQIEGAGVRLNSIPFAAFGLVWKRFGEELSGNALVAELVDRTLVLPIDANDNGIDLSRQNLPHLSSYEIFDVIRAFIPTWQEKQAPMDDAFAEAVSFAKRIIVREIRRAAAVVAGQKKIKEAYLAATDKRLVVLDEDYSWKNALAEVPEPLYVVHPQNGTWRLYCVRDNPHLFVNRKDLPEAWAGLRDTELTKITGVSDAVFCHRNRFMAVAKSKEGATELARKALTS